MTAILCRKPVNYIHQASDVYKQNEENLANYVFFLFGVIFIQGHYYDRQGHWQNIKAWPIIHTSSRLRRNGCKREFLLISLYLLVYMCF